MHLNYCITCSDLGQRQSNLDYSDSPELKVQIVESPDNLKF